MMMPPKYITFDCYDTLVEFPIDDVTRRILGPRADQLDFDEFCRTFERIRYQAILEPFRPYRDVLRESLQQAMDQFGLTYEEDEGSRLVDVVSTFGPWPDVPGVLERLREHFKIVIISNSDDDIIAGNVRTIGVPFDRVITAEQARAYKPSHAIFEYTLRTLNCASGDLLHVAQGFEYDIIPANQLGWDRVWINRYGKPGDPAYQYRELPDLSGLPDLLGV
jgi:2-haloacid dehalogenase